MGLDAQALEEQAKIMKNIVLFLGGFLLVIFGMALVFRHWGSIVIVWQGVMPPAIAVAGLVMMFAASLKK